MGKKIDLTGERFGRLNVLSEVPERDRDKKVLWNVCVIAGRRRRLPQTTLGVEV